MFNWFQSLLPRTSDFFGMFEAHAATLVAAAGALTSWSTGDPPPQDQIAEIDRREHEADDIIRQVLRTVRQTFLTPFDRGAITSLIGAMDDAIDEMQDTARAIALYEVRDFEPEMKRMVKIIVEAAGLTAQAMPMLRDISRNGARIHDLTEKLVQLESDADDRPRRRAQEGVPGHSATSRCNSSSPARSTSISSGSPTRSRMSRTRSTAS